METLFLTFFFFNNEKIIKIISLCLFSVFKANINSMSQSRLQLFKENDMSCINCQRSVHYTFNNSVQ